MEEAAGEADNPFTETDAPGNRHAGLSRACYEHSFFLVKTFISSIKVFIRGQTGRHSLSIL